MSLSHHTTFASIGEIVARQILPRLRHAQKLPLRISCIGIASDDESDDVGGFDRTLVIGQCQSPEEALIIASQRVARGDFRVGQGDALRFRPASWSFRTTNWALSLPVRSGPGSCSGSIRSPPTPRLAAPSRRPAVCGAWPSRHPGAAMRYRLVISATAPACSRRGWSIPSGARRLPICCGCHKLPDLSPLSIH